MLAHCLALYEQISLPVAGLCTVTFFPVTFFSYLPTISFSLLLLSYCYPDWINGTITYFPNTCILIWPLLLSFLLLFFLLAHCFFFSCQFIHTATQMNCYLFSCFFFPHLSTVTFFPVTFFLPETVTFFPVSFFPTCPLLLSFLLLFFLLLFFLPETVTFFPVTFFPVTFFPCTTKDTPPITKINLEISCLKFHSNPQGVNESRFITGYFSDYRTNRPLHSNVKAIIPLYGKTWAPT